jgi:hypothetical protein
MLASYIRLSAKLIINQLLYQLGYEDLEELKYNRKLPKKTTYYFINKYRSIDIDTEFSEIKVVLFENLFK